MDSKHYANGYLLLLLGLIGSFGFLGHAPVDSDLWWHLKTGLLILELGELPTSDPFSFATEGRQWVNHEWLAQLILGFVHHNFDFQGLVSLRAILFLLTLLFFFLGCWWENRNTRTAFAVSLLFFAPLLDFYLNLRPRAYLLLVVAIIVLLHQAARSGKYFVVWAYPLLMLPLVNIHGGFVFVLGFITLSLLSLSTLERGVDGARLRVFRYSSVGVWGLSALAIWCNPYGTQLVEFVFQEMGSSHPHISEWQPLSSEQAPAFIGISLLTLMVPLAFRTKRMQWTLMCFWLASGYLTWQYNRFFILFLMFSLTFAVTSLPKGFESRWTLVPVGSRRELFILVGLLLPVCIFGFRGVRNHFKGVDALAVDPKRYPTQAVEFLKSHQYGQRLGLPFDWGGFAIWHLYPTYLVSIDGRYASVYGQEYADEQIRGYLAGNVALLQSRFKSDVFLAGRGSKLESQLEESGQWRKVFQDRVASIFIDEGVEMNSP